MSLAAILGSGVYTYYFLFFSQKLIMFLYLHSELK